ncbi:DNA recombination-dependent growth factor C [Yersinia rohdei]|uniref:recombination-associated protein RdgC n=1 Tax=Yersinia rohdei TaxID=29485 RepID=UPI00061BDB16|nr:recombination-associated protein RdgC [Yersinia rohdei]CNF17155.1 DNA recombination-dependent growth factor C [Yersinia rohdei]
MALFNLKNLLIYRLNREVIFNTEELEKQLSVFKYMPCGSQDLAKSGWVSPLGKHSDSLTHSVNGQILVTVLNESKILPPEVVRKELQERLDKLEGEQHRKFKKTEKDSLKDEVLHTLIPRAFSKFNKTQIWIDTKTNLIIVDASSAKKAEDALSLMRKSLGSLPVTPFYMDTPIELTITEWVRSGNLPAGFTLQDEAELTAILEDGGIIRCKKQDLIGDEIATNIEAGKLVTKLSLDWQERITFILSEDNSIKRIKFSDILLEQNDDIDREDLAQRFDAEFLLLTGELSALIKDLTIALGGESKN